MRVIRLAAGLSAACLVFSACSNPKAAEVTPAETKTPKNEIVLSPEQMAMGAIETQTAALSQETDVLHVKGRIVPADDRVWRVGVRTIGLVTAVYAGLGDLVHKGQVLARYHADEVRDSRAQYRAALSELDRVKAAAAQAQRARDRAQRLLELKAGSVQQLEQTQQDLVDAQAAIRKAEIEVDRGRDLLEDDLRVPADPPANRKDETEDEVPIFAPGDGYVVEKGITPGKTVELSDVTFVIADLSRVWMLASVRQEDLGPLHTGQPATVFVPGQAELGFRGTITNVGQELDPETRMMPVRIVLDNPAHRLRPEMLASAAIPSGARGAGILLPSEAIQQVNGQDAVFVRTAPGRFALRAVRMGETAEGRVPVLEGITPGEEVVVRGSFVLKSQLLKSTLENE